MILQREKKKPKQLSHHQGFDIDKMVSALKVYPYEKELAEKGMGVINIKTLPGNVLYQNWFLLNAAPTPIQLSIEF